MYSGYDLCRSQNNWVMKYDGLVTWHVLERKRVRKGFWLEKLTEGDHIEDIGTDGLITLTGC